LSDFFRRFDVPALQAPESGQQRPNHTYWLDDSGRFANCIPDFEFLTPILLNF
jgi:hypothetical protein